jgi:DNA-binding transcriptional LysR family regulator
MKIDPRHLEILAAIVDAGGLTEGSERVGKSQPSVSRSMALLEERVGQPLFIKGRRPLKPTELGTALAREGLRILEIGHKADLLIEDFKKGVSGAIKIGGTPVFMDGVVSTMIADFQNTYPDIRIDQINGYPSELTQMVSNASIDAAILPIRPLDVAKDLEFRQVLTARNVIACRIGHPVLRTPNILLEDIAKFSWVGPPKDSPLFRDLQNTLESIGIQDLNIKFSGGSLNAITNVLRGSDALAILPYSVVQALKDQHQLDSLSLRIGDPDRHLGILVRRSKDTSSATLRFLEYIEAAFETLRSKLP